MNQAPTPARPPLRPGEQAPPAKTSAREWLRRLRLIVGIGVMAGLVATVLSLAWGYLNAWSSSSRARERLAVQIIYAGQTGEAEFLYGPFAGASVELRGHDTAIWVEPALLEQDGELRRFYEALAQLEDRDVETGFGINPRGLGRALFTLGDSGGSSLHDQTCDAMEGGFELSLVEQALPRIGQRLINKLDNTLCGVGLARQFSPTEVVALYATYGYLGPGAYGIDSFARIYWRFDGVTDPRVNVGHQLVLAALFNKPWNGEVSRWQGIEQRARHALELLIGEGLIDPAKRVAIHKQIQRAKPMSKAELERKGYRRRLARAPSSLDYAVYRAAREAEARFGPEWRTQVAQLELTIDRARQVRTLAASRLPANLIDQGARVTVAVVNERGEYLALHTGTSSFDESDRIRAMRSPGSVTKLLVAAGLAHTYGAAFDDDPRPAMSDVQEALRRSNSHFFTLANQLDVDRTYVGALIECYGDGHAGARENLIEDAAKGSLEASPESLLPMLQDAEFGSAHAMPDPHVVRRFVLRSGAVQVAATEPSWDRERCATLIHNDGATTSWFEIPMRGTMIAARRRVETGKTGSVGGSSETDALNTDLNYWTLAIGGRSGRDGGYETGVVVLGADAFYDAAGNDLAIVGLEQASRSAVPMLAEIMAPAKR